MMMRGSRSGAGAPVAKRSGRAAQCSRVLAPGVTAKLLTLARAAPSPQSSHAAAQLTMQSSGSAFVNGAGLKLQVVQGKRLHRAAVRPRSYTRFAPRMCGIIGIFKHEGNCNVELYEGLLMLQHRGQDSAGMVTTDWDKFKEYKENGLVKDVFGNQNLMDSMRGNTGIAHVRYPTAGSSSAQEAQPFFVNSPLGIYLIHNGNLTNSDDMRTILNSSRSFFNRHLRTDSDSEVLLNILADEVHRAHQRCLQTTGCDPNRNKTEFLFEAGATAMRLLKGAYSCLSLVKGVGLVAFRDPFGIRPLVLGRRKSPLGDEYCIASEDCAFGPIGFERMRDINPGEMVIVSQEGKLLSRQLAEPKLTPCIFEYIYLARPDSVLNKIPVYNFQLALGSRLAKRVVERGWELDLVCPVPDGSRPAAIQMAADLHLPYREGLVKNRYVGRTFIMPDQRLREMSVRRKLNAMPTVFQGKNVLLVDDSIVRGTTMSQIVSMVRNAGAAKVYLASSAPPVRYPNVYGVDMPTRKEFVAHGLTEQQVCEVLGADGLIYQDVDDLIEVGRELNTEIHAYDASCFDGKYCTGDIDDEYLARLEVKGRGANRQRAGQKTSLLSNGSSSAESFIGSAGAKEPAAV